MRWNVAILATSDRGAAGATEMTSAQVIRELVEEEMHGEIVEYRVVPDEKPDIMAALIEMADYHKAHLIITTGGIGMKPRDVTPEATIEVCEKLAPGFAEAVRAASMQRSPMVMLTRAAAGIRGGTLIINLPGDPKGVHESLAVMMNQIPLALAMVSGLYTEEEI